MSKKVKEEIFSGEYSQIGDMELTYKVIERKVRVEDEELLEKIVITHSPKRTLKDRADRERLIKKARKLLENASRIKAGNKRGGKNI